jgi:transposase
MDNTIKQNGCDTLHLPPYNPNLKPIKLVWGDIKNRTVQECMSTNLKEMQIRYSARKYLLNTCKKYGKSAAPM